MADKSAIEWTDATWIDPQGRTSTTWDHIVPIIAGGLTVPGNIVPACGSCNSSKRDSEVVEWARKRGFILDLVGDVTTLVAA